MATKPKKKIVKKAEKKAPKKSAKPAKVEKKAAPKKVAPKKIEKKATVKAAPKKKTPPPVVEAPKKAEKVVAPSGKKAEKVEKKGRPSRSAVVRELDGKAKAFVETLDLLFKTQADTEKEIQEELEQFAAHLGKTSFVHPKRGEMSVMARNGRWFWREKPAGQWASKKG